MKQVEHIDTTFFSVVQFLDQHFNLESTEHLPLLNLRYSLYGGQLLLRRACVWCVEEGQKKLSSSKIPSKRIVPRSWHLRNLIILCYEKMMCNVFKFMLITTLHSVSLLLLSSYKKGNALSYPLNSLPSLASLSLSCFPPLLHFMLCHVRTQGNALSPRSTGLDWTHLFLLRPSASTALALAFLSLFLPKWRLICS